MPGRCLFSLLLAVLITACLALPASAEPPQGEFSTLQSGSLEVRVRHSPFAVEWVDRSDGDVLRTLSGGDARNRYGSIGYSFDLRVPVLNNAYLGYYQAAEGETVWFHGKRVTDVTRSGNALVALVDTGDPLGHKLRLTLTPRREGAVTLDSRIAPGSGPYSDRASLSGAAFAPAAGERFLGFGSRSNAVDQTGNEVFNWAEEGPFSGGNGEAFVRPLLPNFTFPTGPTATNFPVPWLVSTRGLGVLIDQTQRSKFRLLNERSDAWHAEAEADFLALSVFAGPTPAAVVRRYSDHAGGRQPDPASWIFGPWVQFRDNWEEKFRAQDVPTTVGQTYTHYLPCGAHIGRETAEQATVDRYHRLGYKITTYFNPHVCTEYQSAYNEAASNGWLVKRQTGEPYLLSNPFTADELIAEIDFTNAGARAFFRRLLDDAINRGYDGWMEDFGEYTPTDSVFSDGRGGLEMHNLYPVLYHQASYEHTRAREGSDSAVFIRSGWHGVQPHARVVWGGDPTEDWSCADGLCAAVHQSVNMGLTGVAYQGSDIGGFHAVANSRTNDELTTRWLQAGAVAGVMRTQANGFAFQDNRATRSQVWSPAVLPTWRRYAKLRTQLLPYLEAASVEYQRSAMPIVRHFSLLAPNDARAVRSQLDFGFGPDLVAAPVVTPGARMRTAYLPRGRWIDLGRSTAYRESDGTLALGRATVLAGGREHDVPAPLGELPLFARTGTILPLLAPDVDTLADVGSGAGLVSLKDRRDRMQLLAWPRGASSARFFRRERLSSLEGVHDRTWTLRLGGARTRRYDLQASFGAMRRPFVPCRVELDGKPLSKRIWSFDRASQVLRVSFRTVRGRLVAKRSCS